MHCRGELVNRNKSDGERNRVLRKRPRTLRASLGTYLPAYLSKRVTVELCEVQAKQA